MSSPRPNNNPRPSILTSNMTPMEALKLQETALRHCHMAEGALALEQEPLSTIAATGAFILARAAYFAHQALAGQDKIPPYRQLAHAILSEVLDEIELLMTQTEGRA